MLGAGQIDSINPLKVAFARGYGFKRAGAMRTLASFFADVQPDVAAVSEIDDGEALSLATRFAWQWAYRAEQAIFWSARFTVGRVRDERRGSLHVEGTCDGRPLHLFAFRFPPGRGAVRELRAARASVRHSAGGAVLFVTLPCPGSAGFGGLNLTQFTDSAAPDIALASRDAGVEARLLCSYS